MRTLIQDLRVAIRSLQRARGFAAVSIGILALGIASSTVVFTFVHAVLLRSLPYPDAERLMILHWKGKSQIRGDVSSAAFFMLKEHTPTSSENVAAIYPLSTGMNLAGPGTREYVKGLRVSIDFFTTVGVLPTLGRAFRPEEDMASSPCTVILSYRLWQRSFDNDPEVYGRHLHIDGQLCEIIGVMPRGFRSYPDADVWLPLRLDASSADPGSDYRVIVRLKPGFTVEQAGRELEWLSDQYHLNYLSSSPERAKLVLEPLHHFQVGGAGDRLSILLGAVIFLLLIACTNVAVLLLVRALSRTQETTIRVALGSSWARLVRAVLLESIVLTAVASLLGLILAKESFPFVLAFAPAELPRIAEVKINGNVVVFAIAISVFTSLLSSLVPALRISRVTLDQGLKQTSRTASLGIWQVRMGAVLVSTQAALTLILLAGSTLLLRNYLDLEAVAPGFDPRGVSVAQVSLPCQPYCTTVETARFTDRIVERLNSTAGIEGVATVNGLPLERGLNLPLFAQELPKNIEHAGEYRIVSEQYFSIMRTPLITGRPFSSDDNATANRVAIINETLARRWWPDSSPIGHFIQVSDELGTQFSDAARQIVGVAADVHESGLDRPTRPSVFVPLKQAPDKITAFANLLFMTSIVVRTADHTDFSREIRDAIEAADPELPMASLRPLTQVLHASLARHRFYAFLTGAFAVFALVLTALGLYALLSYQLKLRTRELAIRMALGTPPSKVVRLVVGEGMLMVTKGVIVGMVGVFGLRLLLRSMVPNLPNIDLGAVLIAIGSLGVVAALVSALTGVRAASIDPMVIVRNE